MLFFKMLGDTYIINKTNLTFSLTFRNNTYSEDTWDWKNVAERYNIKDTAAS